jgi:D-3-phosphoglycerate dehydrogenase
MSASTLFAPQDAATLIRPGKAACLIVQPVHPVAHDVLKDAGIAVIEGRDAGEAAGDVVAVIVRDARIDPPFIDRHPALRVIAKHGAGLDAIAVDDAKARGIAVVSTPGVNAQSVAEHALMLILALARRLPEMTIATRAGDATARYRLPQMELAGARLGIVGFGQTGNRLGVMARAIGMQVCCYSPSVPGAALAECGVVRCGELRELLATCDVVSLHLPARPGTLGLIGREELALMRPGAILVNVGRGGVVNEAAAAEALAAGRLGGLGLDVLEREPVEPDHPLLGFPNAIITPHAAGSSTTALAGMARQAAEQIVRELERRSWAVAMVTPDPRAEVARVAAIEGNA